MAANLFYWLTIFCWYGIFFHSTINHMSGKLICMWTLDFNHAVFNHVRRSTLTQIKDFKVISLLCFVISKQIVALMKLKASQMQPGKIQTHTDRVAHSPCVYVYLPVLQYSLMYFYSIPHTLEECDTYNTL